MRAPLPALPFATSDTSASPTCAHFLLLLAGNLVAIYRSDGEYITCYAMCMRTTLKQD